MKIYVSTYYRHRRDGELYQTYAEIDSGRREIRKVGTFAGGRGERVGVDLPNSEFAFFASASSRTPRLPLVTAVDVVAAWGAVTVSAVMRDDAIGG
ncbi:hypothetical protein [Actinoplanes sp. NBRC 101535]|uniref:hypothetical protein n=1 Tax=Actinoplanes sp. NBRC 101535 TaxID=3032196 RepID=UPI0024A36C47|nr:hypothetical protein [Actinoplanes sp. NBRC 101535]GLY05512.1 hypothetical protein Acsp01_58910 [Actinoplanes sp. NBRC 101535]